MGSDRDHAREDSECGGSSWVAFLPRTFGSGSTLVQLNNPGRKENKANMSNGRRTHGQWIILIRNLLH